MSKEGKSNLTSEINPIFEQTKSLYINDIEEIKGDKIQLRREFPMESHSRAVPLFKHIINKSEMPSSRYFLKKMKKLKNNL